MVVVCMSCYYIFLIVFLFINYNIYNIKRNEESYWNGILFKWK